MRRASPSQVGAVLLLLGVVLGTLADRTPQRQPLRAGDYWVLSGDFHVHAFPGDGLLAPWLLRREAARAGLDVIAVTNHNQVLTGRLARWISSRSHGAIMITGQEITNPAYHMIAVGVERTIDAGQPAASAAADVHAQHAVTIAAHPSPRFHGYDPDEAIRRLDATEAAHSGVLRDPAFRAELSAFYQRARGLKPSIAAIGSSDFHGTPPVLGTCRTYLFVRERSEAGVLDAIRSGRTLAVDSDGNLQGASSLIELVRSARPQGRSDQHRRWRQISVAFAWIGVLGMVLLRS